MNKDIIAVHGGGGVVGSSLADYFIEQGYDARRYDPPQKMLDAITDADIHFLAVPTPFIDQVGFDSQYIELAGAFIDEQRQGKETIIVIKSTVLPQTTERLQKRYPHHIILFSPEFLVAKQARHDTFFPKRQIVGYVDERGKTVSKQILDILPYAPFQKIMKATEAELVKYFSNSWLASKVVFANMVYDFCQAMEVDYDMVKEAAKADDRVGKSHLEIFHDGQRGYAGACFPKDIRAMIQKGDELGVDTGLLKEAERLNNLLRNL